MLPDLNGLEILHIIKKRNPEIKVLIHSGYLVSNVVKLAHDHKADGILEKPSSVEEIKKAITTILSGNAYYSPRMRENLPSY